MQDITRRKTEHIEVVLTEDTAGRNASTGLEEIEFEHVALPELDIDEIDLSISFLGRTINAPLLISSMTGGPKRAQSINQAIAEAAGETRIAFGVGSQRIALDDAVSAGFDRRLRKAAGSVPILANFGAAQLRAWNGLEMARRAVEMIEADALIIHLNPLQEAVQSGGDRNWRDLLAAIEQLARVLPFPIVVKEVGNGISGNIALRLWNAGVKIIDVAGAGGTSWSAVEAKRAPDARSRAIASAFRDWGVPTARAIVDVRGAAPEATIIASGGIRTGIDVARAIRLGADLAGQAAGLLGSAIKGPDILIDHLSTIIEQLRITCFCTASRDIAALRTARLIERRPLIGQLRFRNEP